MRKACIANQRATQFKPFDLFEFCQMHEPFIANECSHDIELIEFRFIRQHGQTGIGDLAVFNRQASQPWQRGHARQASIADARTPQLKSL